jgi:hypothetical protein
MDITDMVDWQSTDDDIGDVNTAGLATGGAPGETEITASYDVGGNIISDTAVLTVSDAILESIIVTPENSTIQVGENLQYRATGTFSDNSEQDITELATWRTTNNSVGTISNSSDSRGLFSSIASGATIIEASFGGISGETLLTVFE